MGKIRTALWLLAIIGPCLAAAQGAAGGADLHSPWADDGDVLGAAGGAPAKPAIIPPVSSSQPGQPSPEDELRMVDEAVPGMTQSPPPAAAPGISGASPGSGGLRQYDLAPGVSGASGASPAGPAGAAARNPAMSSPQGAPSRPAREKSGAPLPVYIGIRAQ